MLVAACFDPYTRRCRGLLGTASFRDDMYVVLCIFDEEKSRKAL
jgi:hypothetical protein